MPAQATLYLIAGLALFTAAVYRSTTTALWRYWIEEPYLGGHGPLVAALALWLLYRVRGRVAVAPVAPIPWALLPLVLCSIASLVFWRAGIQGLQLWMLPALVLIATFAAFGGAVTRIVFVPIAYLYFAMPAWNVLTSPLQNLTLHMVGLIGPIVGLPVTLSGTLIIFPDGTAFEVTPACSGVGFLVQGLAVATLIGELEYGAWARRIRLLGVMFIIALATNWLRVLLLVGLGYSSGMRNVLASTDHLQFGYVLFAAVLILFAWATARGMPPRQEPVAAAAVSRPRLNWYAASLGALAIAPLLVGIRTAWGSRPTSAAEVRPVTGRAGWRGPLPLTDTTWQPVFVGTHAESHATYESTAGRRVETIAIGYAEQEQGRELVNESNSLLGSGGLTAADAGLVSWDGRQFRELMVKDAAGARSVIWWFYDIEGRTFVVPILSQLWYGVSALTSPAYSALFAFKAACMPTCDTGRETISQFVRDNGPHVLPSESMGLIQCASTDPACMSSDPVGNSPHGPIRTRRTQHEVRL